MTVAPPSAALAADRPCLFGGSFDPVHEGHLFTARSACDAFGLDHVTFVPAAAPPHKPGVVLAEPRHRVAMLGLALQDEPHSSVWGVELERSGPSYTIDTVRAFRGARGVRGGVHLLLGGDNLGGLREWREVEELLALAQPVVVHRGEDTSAHFAALEDALSPTALGRLEAGLVELDPCPISATEVRRRVAAGESIEEQVPARVAEYIASQGIYRPR